MSQVHISAQIRCPFCHDSILNGPRTGCPECLAWHHTACLAEHGACSTCTAPAGEQRTFAEEVSEALSQTCQAENCYSVEVLERPRRIRLCERHARAQLSAYTAGGAFSLIFGVGFGLLMLALAMTGEPGPWPLFSIPAVLCTGIGVLVIRQHSAEAERIDAAVANRAAAEPEPELRARPRPQKVAS